MHNHAHHEHDHAHHHSMTNKKKLLLVIIFNIIITLSEYIGGLLSGSLALLSDAGHNLSDVLSLMLGYAGEKVSEKSPTKKYTFGLKRFEVFIALVNSISLVVIGIIIVREAVERFINPVPVKIEIMIPVAIIGLLGNLFSIIALFKNKEANLNMKAAFLHLFYDTISSFAVIIAGIVLYFTKFYIIDLVISLLIVVMIIWSSIGIIRESFRIFLQGTPPHIDTDEVYNSLLRIEGIESIHGLHIWSISSTEVFLSCHICVCKDNKDIISDLIIKQANDILENEYHIQHSAIQIEIENICPL